MDAGYGRCVARVANVTPNIKQKITEVMELKLLPFQGEGRNGDGWSAMSDKTGKDTHPHPSLPLEGEGEFRMANNVTFFDTDTGQAMRNLRSSF